MRLILRVLGTWLVGVAVILIIIDGTRSLAANSLVITSLNDTWMELHPDSLAQVQAFLETRLFGPVLEQVADAVLRFPGWAVIGVPGILIAYAGRSRRVRTYLRHDGI